MTPPKHQRGTLRDRDAQPIIFVVMLNTADFMDAEQAFANIDLATCWEFCAKKPKLRAAGRYEVQCWQQRDGWEGTYLWNKKTRKWEKD